jgi:hypothetical protein
VDALTIPDLLRGRGDHAPGAPRVAYRSMALCALAGGAAYGAVMGSSGLAPLQALYSAIKVPMLLGVATLVCLPSFFVLNTLLGLRDDFRHALRGVLAAQATLAVALASLAPLTVVAYLSSTSYRFDVLWNGLPFLIATLAGQVALARHYRPLIARNPRHRVGRNAWLLLYVFVAIQMAWVLRPFVGFPGLETRLFRPDAWSNAYVVISTALWDLLRGRGG